MVRDGKVSEAPPLAVDTKVKDGKVSVSPPLGVATMVRDGKVSESPPLTVTTIVWDGKVSEALPLAVATMVRVRKEAPPCSDYLVRVEKRRKLKKQKSSHVKLHRVLIRVMHITEHLKQELKIRDLP